MDRTVWTTFARFFSRHDTNAVALDLPGHGHSEGPALDSVAAMADWVLAVMDELGAGEFAFVGHSMGSLIGIDLAGRYPARVRRLSLIGIAYPLAVSEALLDAAKNNEPLGFDMVNTWGHGAKAQLGGISAPGIWMMGNGIRLLERTPSGSLYADLTACNDYDQGLVQAGNIRCPVQLVLGDNDLMTPPRNTKALTETLADVEIVTLPGIGHSLMAEDPNHVLDALRSFH
jgi:pimeloyl-ACP methyl ester carboxylesterase